MSLTVLQAVTAINDATMLVNVLTPLVEKARALGRGDHDPVTDEELDANSAAIVARADRLIAAGQAVVNEGGQ